METKAPWAPANGYTTLDTIGPDKWRNFQFAITRNGHYVGFFLVRKGADEMVTKRRVSHPQDTWDVVIRPGTEAI